MIRTPRRANPPAFGHEPQQENGGVLPIFCVFFPLRLLQSSGSGGMQTRSCTASRPRYCNCILIAAATDADGSRWPRSGISLGRPEVLDLRFEVIYINLRGPTSRPLSRRLLPAGQRWWCRPPPPLNPPTQRRTSVCGACHWRLGVRPDARRRTRRAATRPQLAERSLPPPISIS